MAGLDGLVGLLKFFLDDSFILIWLLPNLSQGIQFFGSEVLLTRQVPFVVRVDGGAIRFLLFWGKHLHSLILFVLLPHLGGSILG
mmetsp:Transcript_10708/g.10826  ORF Transcript_10708/g.10826 Transcript_10708/m.10826 type:complete len:85 (-) Transcript_10708:39-293(-)